MIPEPAHRLENTARLVSGGLVLATSGLALYTGGAGPFQASIQRGLFLLMVLPLVFLRVPSGLFHDPVREKVLGFALSGLHVVVMVWTLVHFERLYSEPFIAPLDVTLGVVGLLLILEAVRRTVGWSVALALLAFLAYAVAGPWVPVRLLRHAGLDLHDLASFVFYGTFGVFGKPLGVCATLIVIIVMFGAMLMSTGGAELLMNMGKMLAGRFSGGAAKIAVVSSSMMGMVTGATVANVATTGAVTIPMMIRAGYEPRFAAAVEALASCGGQLMPPIMGAAAFIMVDYLNISYGRLIVHAVIPAVLYFFAVFTLVHVRSVKCGIRPIERGDIPSLGRELVARGNMLIPLVVLVTLLAKQYSVMYAGFAAVVTATVMAALRPATRMGPRQYYQALDRAMNSMLTLVPICAGAGVMIGVLTATGLNLKLTYVIEAVAAGRLFVTLVLTMLVSIVLGMGLPTVAAYVVLATLLPPTLTALGVLPVAAHLFLFYFAILSAITPPVCTGAYVAAGIAGTNPVQTGLVAIRLGLVCFLLPFAFVYQPALLGEGSLADCLLHTTCCGLGIFFWALALEGYFRGTLALSARGMLAAAGVMLFWPHLLVSAAGAASGGVVLAMRLRAADAAARKTRPEAG